MSIENVARILALFQHQAKTSAEVDAVQAQTEQAHSAGIWNALLSSDVKRIRKCVAQLDNLVDVRGAVGETILHLCFLYNTPQLKEYAKTELYPLCPALLTCHCE